MNHHTTGDFWDCYDRLPESVRKVADANFELLKSDSHHPSLHFKRVGVSIGFRALAAVGDDGPVWFWIGSHAEYDRILRGA